jgi:hypothetical protein
MRSCREAGRVVSGAAKLCYDKPHKQFVLLERPEIEVAAPTPAQLRRSVDVDVGLGSLAVATDL